MDILCSSPPLSWWVCHSYWGTIWTRTCCFCFNLILFHFDFVVFWFYFAPLRAKSVLGVVVLPLSVLPLQAVLLLGWMWKAGVSPLRGVAVAMYLLVLWMYFPASGELGLSAVSSRNVFPLVPYYILGSYGFWLQSSSRIYTYLFCLDHCGKWKGMNRERKESSPV